LRVRTTNDNAGLAFANQNSAEQHCHSILVRMIKMLSLITYSTDLLDHSEANLVAISQTVAVNGIDFKNPFTMSNREPRSHYQRLSAELVSSSLEKCLVVEPIGIEPMT
jgi:hypothetical protein